jgi:drug/metabolite transporter (DMT)-like permease
VRQEKKVVYMEHVKIKDKYKGILLIIMAGFFFSLMTFFVRLSGNLPTMQKAFFRNAVAAVIAFVMLAKTPEGFKVKKGSWPCLFARCACGTAGLICNFYAIDKMNIADANILNKLSPFFAIVASYFILKEKPNKVEWLAVITAFVGALFVVKPSFHMEFVYALIGLFGGLGAGVAYTFVRKLGMKGERGPVIVMCFSLFSCLVTLPFMIVGYKHMSMLQTLYLILAGVSAAGGQFSITAAYQKAPAKEISVFDYSQVIFAAILGFVFLDQIPDVWSAIGYIVIIGSALGKWYYSMITTDYNAEK